MSLSAQLRDISSKHNESKYALYESLADQVVKSNKVEDILTLARHLVQVEGSEQYGRTYIMPDIVTLIIDLLADREGKNENPLDVDELTPLMRQMVDLIRAKAEDMPDALMNAIELLAQCHQASGEFKSAAYTLSSFKFDDFKGKCTASLEKRTGWYVQTAEFFLAIGEAGLASQQIKRAHANVSELNKKSQKGDKTATALVWRFKTAYARILDAERKFLEASLRYMELSQSSFDGMSDADRMKSLEYAVTCAILAKAGPPRSRVLALLCSDERCRTLHNDALLIKMFNERIISQTEVEAFEKTLQEHQKADTASKRTVLQNSVIEHNMLAASRIYQNIRFDQLGSLLGISANEAESVAGSMIEQGRLKATIDQADSLLEFQSGGDELESWDVGIGDVCQTLNKIVDDITKKYPQYDGIV